ncbi:uncharacterized protein DUF397 [Murinocardiopsis flavida]|uniref:Uncharacterized protein DUF397 n=1 Tax=Murinocardiopsis flavida TaxID=645275 RepID=A0A2P8CXC9_9ACTN|nr:DUF397 domain-containing protein [Murinocardiopsis flavida]PSK89641.1 uncharacterized protein DUF397 [Murinocardiopsis flavida]
MRSEIHAWRKSSYSNASGGHCVEVAELPEGVLVRDSRFPADGCLSFPTGQWAALLRDVKDGTL